MKLIQAAAILTVVFVLGCVSPPERPVTTTIPQAVGPQGEIFSPTTSQPALVPVNSDQNAFSSAVAAQDPSKCAKVGDRRMANVCMREVAVRKRDVTLCALIEYNKDWPREKAACYFNIAVLTRNITLCGLITDDSATKSMCETKVSTKT
jgi:hypothetical protein